MKLEEFLEETLKVNPDFSDIKHNSCALFNGEKLAFQGSVKQALKLAELALKGVEGGFKQIDEKMPLVFELAHCAMMIELLRLQKELEEFEKGEGEEHETQPNE